MLEFQQMLPEDKCNTGIDLIGWNLLQPPLTRKEARSIEQVLIERNKHFTNKINSISKNREWYEEAIEWGTEWIENNLN